MQSRREINGEKKHTLTTVNIIINKHKNDHKNKGVGRGESYRSDSQHRQLTLERRKIRRSCHDSNLWHFDHKSRALSLSNNVRPKPLPGTHLTVASSSWWQEVEVGAEELLQSSRLSSSPLHRTYIMWMAPDWGIPNRDGVSYVG